LGDQHRTFLVTYPHAGEWWGLEIKARDADDARARLRQLAYAKVDGELALSVYVPIGPLARLRAWTNSARRFLKGACERTSAQADSRFARARRIALTGVVKAPPQHRPGKGKKSSD
jgi:hypothetical protein